MWFGSSDYDCPWCDGNGDVQCDCCGGDEECSHCRGSGLDSEQIDIRAYEKACRAMKGPGGGTGAWVEGRKYIGRRSMDGSETVAIADFIQHRPVRVR